MANQGEREGRKEKENTVNVKAEYKSPTETKDFVLPMKAKLSATSSASSVAEKVSYLSELRANTRTLQAEINSFLTEKMTEDKAREAAGNSAAGHNKTETKIREDLEEENYGEEAEEEEG